MKEMDKERQLHLAETFRARHRALPLLLLANAWDAVSARIVEEAGFDAVATTSGGVNWALGYADGEAAPWSEVVAATARMARVLHVPLTADIEAGYGGSPAEVAKSVAEIIAAGAVGINLEDGTAPQLRRCVLSTMRQRAYARREMRRARPKSRSLLMQGSISI